MEQVCATALAVEMKRLPFAVRGPDRLPREGFRLVGARYCSLLGEPAAQMRLRGPDGAEATLYEIANWPFAVADGRMQIGEVAVRVWREGDRFFGWATTTP